MREWLTQLPLWLFGIIVLSLFIGLSLGGLVLTRRWMEPHKDHPNDLAGFVYAVVGVIYAVLIGMSALASHAQFNEVQELANQEATSIGDLARDLEAYPSPTGPELQAMLRTYLDEVIQRELPALRRGHDMRVTDSLVDRMVLTMARFEPRTEGQKIMHAQAMAELNDFMDHRGARLKRGQVGQQPIVWFVLLSGAALTIGFTYLFWARSPQLHAMMVACLAGVIGLTVFWMAAMDHPLWGPLAISEDTFLRERVTLERLPHTSLPSSLLPSESSPMAR